MVTGYLLLDQPVSRTAETHLRGDGFPATRMDLSGLQLALTCGQEASSEPASLPYCLL
jgi:hypothetical protein